MLRYHVTPLAERLGHPLRKPLRIALRNVVIRDTWAAHRLMGELDVVGLGSDGV